MGSFEQFVLYLDDILNTRRKRHIVGGILLSLSALFGGLACTVLTVKEDKSVDISDVLTGGVDL